jgi:hypothetical protein
MAAFAERADSQSDQLLRAENGQLRTIPSEVQVRAIGQCSPQITGSRSIAAKTASHSPSVLPSLAYNMDFSPISLRMSSQAVRYFATDNSPTPKGTTHRLLWLFFPVNFACFICLAGIHAFNKFAKAFIEKWAALAPVNFVTWQVLGGDKCIGD